MKLEELSNEIINRVPIRNDDNEFYFPNDEFQFMPKDGYIKLFENLLNHKNISINLSCTFTKEMEDEYFHIFNSSAIDEYYNFKFGALPYRSLKFNHVNLPLSQLFPVAQVNFTNDSPYTRIIEWKNIPNSGVNSIFTSLTYEEPCSYIENNNERYYPVKDFKGLNRQKYLKYSKIINNKMTFIGRLGQYVYLDMHQCVNNALIISDKFVKKHTI